MEGTLSEIRMFAGNFAPANWAYCNGSLLSISAYTALFTLLGTTYGGDGQNTFSLPDLRGRLAVGTGQGVGLSNYDLGEITGTEGVSLLTTQMPNHNHQPIVTAGSGTTTATAQLYGDDTGGGVGNPSGAVLGTDGTSNVYGTSTSGNTQLATGAAMLTSLSGPFPTVTLDIAGGSQPHSNIQPVLAVGYIICLEGIYPSRS